MALATVTAVKPAEKSSLADAIKKMVKEMEADTPWWTAPPTPPKSVAPKKYEYYLLKPQEVTLTFEYTKNGPMAHAIVASYPGYAPARLSPRVLELYPVSIDLDVSSDDIMRGQPGSPSGCAIARAVARRFDGANCHVGSSGLTVYSDHWGEVGVHYVDPSGQMNWFINAYDSNFITSGGLRFEPPTDRVRPTTLHLIRAS